jgi:chromosome segregation ATPase
LADYLDHMTDREIGSSRDREKLSEAAALIASLIAERDKLKEELTAEIKLGDARSAECHALRAERDKLKEDCSNLSASRAALFNERNALVERVSVLEKVIERISKASNTDPFRTFDGMIQDMQMIDDIARAALRTSEGA